jgi:hypothetical protein
VLLQQIAVSLPRLDENCATAWAGKQSEMFRASVLVFIEIGSRRIALLVFEADLATFLGIF